MAAEGPDKIISQIKKAVKEMYKKPKLERLDLSDKSDNLYIKFWGRMFLGFIIVFTFIMIVVIALIVKKECEKRNDQTTIINTKQSTT